ncbi:hypothetical protein Cs7R123_45280 [Catellatospora sp. TT07R-123]|uniref:hypothetical protein n=1 Tax=Catellatospora sp. TT07R-123 TaxID=2733863 RepID=UPI001B13908E|nr:hypothetical protein [Catellatospora sp. TT07R-123]GHJ47186.1 hypothetical protein Cs7R123_45280 [Catellatospora sp. TT07R-123]
MIRRLCHAFLTSAARRWPTEMRAEMLAEWRAELHAMPGTARRLRYAASLATSRPHREPAIVVRPGRNLAHMLLSLAVLAGVPVLYPWFAFRLLTSFDTGTIARQAWVGAAGIVAAAVVGIVCAGVTTGVTQLIRPVLVPLWAVGVPYMTTVGILLVERLPFRSTLIDLTCWALSAGALGMLAVLVARGGRPVLSWNIVVVAVAVSFWFRHMHSTLSHFDTMGMEYFFGGRTVPAFAFLVGISPLLHVTIFLLVYAHQLARRHRAVPAQVTVPPVPA